MSTIDDLIARGVIIHAPAATVVQDVRAENFEPGVEVFPGCTLRGPQLRVGAGSRLGLAGGGYFENVCVGRRVDLFGGYFVDATFLDGVIVRGHAEMRGGTLMEEGAECGHHVGYKMTIMLPNVVAGSLVNFCDALMAGGTSRQDHSEIGSALALYNFTPWGDKFASLFGDVPRGVFLRSPKIFVGGQTQIVSPVKVGYGALIPAGCSVRREVPEGRMVGEAPLVLDRAFDASRYGGLTPKFDLTVEYIANLRALEAWYQHVRLPLAADDLFQQAVYRSAMQQIAAGIAERIKRLDKLVQKLPASLALYEQDRASTGAPGAARRIVEHKTILAQWPALQARLQSVPDIDAVPLTAIRTQLSAMPGVGYVQALAALDHEYVAAGQRALQDLVDGVCNA